jgi:hypothetical protein
MTPETLARELETLLNSAGDVYSAELIKVQNKIFNDLLIHFKSLELDDEGYIKQTAENRRILNKAQDVFDESIQNSPYQKALEKHLQVISKVNSLNATYFATISDSFAPNKNFIKGLQTELIANLNTFILGDGLQANIVLPLNQILNQNVNTGGSFSGFLDQVRTYIKGTDEVQGRLLSYSRNYVSDTLFNYSRSYQQSVTADLGLEFYLYSGGLMDTSRPFCQDRAGNFYHHNEVAKWADLSWAGKNKLTTESSIFVLAGGYSCRHSIVPVDTSIVPRETIDRNIKNGNYAP